MKHQTINLVKFKSLSRALGQPLCVTVGVLESLWIFAQIQARDGELSAYSPDDIAGWIEWPGDADHLIESLVKTGWLDQENDRLTIHDWADHKPTWLVGVDAKKQKREGGKKQPSSVPSTQPSCQPSTEPSSEPSSEPSWQLPNLTQPNLTQPNPNNPPSPPEGGSANSDSRKSKKRKKSNHERTYSPEFLADWADWRPYDSPKGDKSQAADVIESFDEETHRQYRQAAKAYCDECHRLRCKTKHVSTFARGDWRQYLVDDPIQAAVTTKEQTELADAERKRRGELFRSWESACVLADGAGHPRPPKPEELTRSPLHYRLGGVLTSANKKTSVRSGEPVQLRLGAS